MLKGLKNFNEEYSVVIGVIGDRGSGKSAIITRLLYEDFLNNNVNIKSNYTLNFMEDYEDKQRALEVEEYKKEFGLSSRSKKVKDLIARQIEEGYKYQMSLKMVSLLPPELQDSVVALDEIQEGADSRRSLSNSNISLTKLATQLRKRKCVLIYSTQRFGSIDKRLRDQTDILIVISNAKYNKRVIEGVFNVEIREKFTGDIISTKIWKAEDFFKLNLYNTYEIIDFESKEEQLERKILEEEKEKQKGKKVELEYD